MVLLSFRSEKKDLEVSDYATEFVVRVTDDLKMMASGKPTLKKWADCWALRELLGIDDNAEDKYAGIEVLRLVRYNVNRWEGSREFDGRWFGPDQLQAG